MIEKITSVLPKSVSFVQKTNSKQVKTADSVKTMPGAESSAYYKGMNNISFKAQQKTYHDLSPIEQSFIKDEEIRIGNILDLDQDINIYASQMKPENKNLNSAGIHITKTQEGDKDVYIITNDMKDKIFEGKFDKNADLPVITYKQGKYMPEITVKDISLNGKSVKMLSGSELIGEHFSLKMPGVYDAPEKSKKISFKGHAVITTLNKEDRTLAAVNKYLDSKMYDEAITGEYSEEVKKNQPEIVIPAGGLGERFKNITRDFENKPSAKMPTNDNYRLIATALNLAASAGIITGSRDDKITYLSQGKSISGDDVKEVGKYNTDGGAITEGLLRGIIDCNKDLIILNGDIFTNADISKAYHALKTLPDAGLVIPYCSVNPERAKALGLLGIGKDSKGNILLKQFVEKPHYTSKSPMPSEFSSDDEYDEAMLEWQNVQTARDPEQENYYLANPGIYLLSNEAAKIMLAKGYMNPEETGLGKNIMPEILKLINEKKLKDADNRPLKAYTLPLEAKSGNKAVWEDLGTAEAFLSLIRDVAYQTKKEGTTKNNKYYGAPEFLLNDFMNNVDLDTGLVYDSPEARESLKSFKEAYNVSSIQGNIYIASAR